MVPWVFVHNLKRQVSQFENIPASKRFDKRSKELATAKGTHSVNTDFLRDTNELMS